MTRAKHNAENADANTACGDASGYPQAARRAVVMRLVIPPMLRCRLRWQHGRERLALLLDKIVGEDTP